MQEIVVLEGDFMLDSFDSKTWPEKSGRKARTYEKVKWALGLSPTET
jgi:hypothetical protein